jgi:hypothetical protein
MSVHVGERDRFGDTLFIDAAESPSGAVSALVCSNDDPAVDWSSACSERRRSIRSEPRHSTAAEP